MPKSSYEGMLKRPDYMPSEEEALQRWHDQKTGANLWPWAKMLLEFDAPTYENSNKMQAVINPQLLTPHAERVLKAMDELKGIYPRIAASLNRLKGAVTTEEKSAQVLDSIGQAISRNKRKYGEDLVPWRLDTWAENINDNPFQKAKPDSYEGLIQRRALNMNQPTPEQIQEIIKRKVPTIKRGTD